VSSRQHRSLRRNRLYLSHLLNPHLREWRGASEAMRAARTGAAQSLDRGPRAAGPGRRGRSDGV